MVDLRPDHLELVKHILAGHVLEYEVRAFGSRVRWTAKETSDLDLVVMTDAPLDLARLADLQEAFSESDLPFRVDVLDWAAIAEDFRRIIKQEYVVIQPGSTSSSRPTWRRSGMVGDLPSTWRLMPLSDCMAAIIDYRGKTPRKTSAGIPLITAKIVKNGRIETPEEFIDPTEYEEWMRRGLPERGDVLVTTEAPLGEVAQLRDAKVALAQRLITLRGKPGLLDNTFLKFLMQSPFVQAQLKARSSGTTVLGIKQSELRHVSLIVPEPIEQHAIAHILGTLDDKVELNRRMNETLEAMARAIFKSWFVDFDPVRAKAAGQQPSGLARHIADLFPDEFVESELGKIPRGWVVESIGSILKAVGGGTPSTKNPDYWDEGIHCFVTPKDLSGLPSPMLLDTERKVTDAGLAKISSGLLPVGTVLLSSRAPVGYLAIAQIPVCVNQGFIAMICDGPVSNYYVLNWTQVHMPEIKRRASGTTFAEISKRNFRPIPVLVPSQEVMAAFDAIAEPVYAKIRLKLEESRTLAALRDTLLPRLISGELRVPDAEMLVEAAV